MTARKMLLGLGSPFAQTRVDFNRLYGTDTSSGTNPFTNPSNLNDGDGTSHADRAADPHATAYVVQSAEGKDSPPTVSQAAPVTAGNVLIVVASKRDGVPSIAAYPAGTPIPHPDRSFTAFASVRDGHPSTPTTPRDGLILGYRIAVGDEQNLVMTEGDNTVIELALAGNPATYEVISATLQAASSTKSLGAFSLANIVPIAGFVWFSEVATQTPGTGYTQDYQGYGGPPLSDHQSTMAMHGTPNAIPSISGGSYPWGGIAVGVTTSAPDETSICQADLGIARPVNRMTLLEASASGTHYAISWSNDGLSWTTITPTFSAVGALQTYDFTATVTARYWRIADNHSPAIALSALTWDTWTIEGFPL